MNTLVTRSQHGLAVLTLVAAPSCFGQARVLTVLFYVALLLRCGMAQASVSPVPVFDSRNPTSVRLWGASFFDTESRSLPAVDVDADRCLALVRADGRVYVQGPEAHYQCRPPAGVFVDVEMGYFHCVGLRSDGTAVTWGDPTGPYLGPIPNVPTGVTYVGIAAGYNHTALLRSDGQIVAIGYNSYGQCNVPPLSVGERYVKVKSQWDSLIALTSTGRVVVWGDTSNGQGSIPACPPGLVYTDVSGGVAHMAAIRSDGVIVAWGSNFCGETVVPTLPAGVRYLLVAAGDAYTVAYRSDGSLVSWGSCGVGSYPIAMAPCPGVTCVQIEVGADLAVARWSDGSVTGWGYDTGFSFGLPEPIRGCNGYVDGDRFDGVASGGGDHVVALRSDGTVYESAYYGVPALPGGMRYVAVRAGPRNTAARRSDGVWGVWGDNTFGQCNLPTPPSGLVYEDVRLSFSHTVALRSDGQVASAGNNTAGECNIPPLPTGMSYLKVDVALYRTLLLRSDGQVVMAGSSGGSSPLVPALPTGLVYTDLAAAYNYHCALRSDGRAVAWNGAPSNPVPALPWGVYYVDADGGGDLVWLRRSDGQVVVLGIGYVVARLQYTTPPLDPGTSYLEIDGHYDTVVSRVGPTCTYVGIGAGCAGSRPATKLVPTETPRIGRTLQVRLFDLPANVAVLAMGWQATTPVDLGSLGMPGCQLAISLDATLPLVGQGHQATWQLSIPDRAELLGLRFYNQALVLDPAAGNALGAVLSDAAEGVIGYP